MTILEAAQALTDALQLSQRPVGMAFTDTIPAGVPAYSGLVPAGCRFWQEATQRVFATVPRDHELCAVGVYTHHMVQTEGVQSDLQDALRVFGELQYVRPEDIAFIPVLEREAKVVVYGPLDSIPVAPDVVLLFVRADQTLILTEASQQVEGGLPPVMGRPACAIVPQAVNIGRTALSLGCCGARAYLDTLTPETALFAIPGSKLEVFAERVEALAKANTLLTRFHSIRRTTVEAGEHPSVSETLAAMA
ncbi:MAG TPA: DUF169 domain-containing protein [Bryobacteraceae bacterium]|nr:DUF169 domain-containing protein [Bryobacteraceae bacterium]